MGRGSTLSNGKSSGFSYLQTSSGTTDKTNMKCLKALLTTGLAISLGILLPHRVLAQTTVTATATPASLSFVYSPGNAFPTAQSVAVEAGAGTPNYTFAITGTNTLWPQA